MSCPSSDEDGWQCLWRECWPGSNPTFSYSPGEGRELGEGGKEGGEGEGGKEGGEGSVVLCLD